MNKKIKRNISNILLLSFLLVQIQPSLAFEFKLPKKTISAEENQVASQQSSVTVVKEKSAISKKISEYKTKKLVEKANKITNSDNTKKIAKTENVVKVTNKEEVVEKNDKKKTSLLTQFKEKRQAKKDKEITVTAKTDINAYSVKIETNNDKELEKQTKKLKTDKTKALKNENALKEESLNSATPEVNTQVVNNKPEAQVESADVFNASATFQGSVSTNEIISVDDCVKIALQNNPSIVSQMMSKDIYKNKIAQAWSNYFPTFNAGVSYSRNDMMFTNFRFPMQKYNLYNTPSLGFNQLIYDFGKTGAQAKVAKKTYEAAQETMQANINDVVYQVKNAYYNLLYLQQQVEVYEDSVLQYQIHLKQAQAYYDIGSKAKIDVSTAQYNLDNTKLTLITAKNSVDNGFAQLTNAMGTPEIPAFSIKEKLDKKKYEIKFEDALDTAYNSRPELLAAKKKMEGSKLLIKSSKVAFLPDIRGYGTYSQGGARPDTDYGYQIGAQFAYSNVNLYLLKKQVDEANLTYKKDQADYEVQRQKVYLDVKQAFIQLRNAQQSIPVARSSMNVAKEQYDLASGRYKVGLGDAIELKDAENTYRTAKLQYYNTLMQYHIAAANLERVIGAPLTASDENL